jgi:hypothetical protein
MAILVSRAARRTHAERPPRRRPLVSNEEGATAVRRHAS